MAKGIDSISSTAFLFLTSRACSKVVTTVSTVRTPCLRCCPFDSDEDLPGIMSIGSRRHCTRAGRGTGRSPEELYNEGERGATSRETFWSSSSFRVSYRSGGRGISSPFARSSNPPSSVYRNAKRELHYKGPDGGCDRLTYWLTDWLRLQTIRFAWLKPCVSNHCKCGTWCLLNYYKRLSWRSQKNLKIIESDLTLDRIGHWV